LFSFYEVETEAEEIVDPLKDGNSERTFGNLRLRVISAFSNGRLRLIVSLLLGYKDVIDCLLCNTMLQAHFKILGGSMLFLILINLRFVDGN